MLFEDLFASLFLENNIPIIEATIPIDAKVKGNIIPSLFAYTTEPSVKCRYN